MFRYGGVYGRLTDKGMARKVHDYAYKVDISCKTGASTSDPRRDHTFEREHNKDREAGRYHMSRCGTLMIWKQGWKALFLTSLKLATVLKAFVRKLVVASRSNSFLQHLECTLP